MGLCNGTLQTGSITTDPCCATQIFLRCFLRIVRHRFFHLPHPQSKTPMQKLLSWEKLTQNTFFSFLCDFTAGDEDSQHSLTCYSSKGRMCSASGSGTAAALGLCPFCLPYLSFCHLLIFHFYDILFWYNNAFRISAGKRPGQNGSINEFCLS